MSSYHLTDEVPKIDTRQESSVIEVFRKRGLPYIETKLDTGDLSYKELLVERKTIDDYYSSFCLSESGKHPHGWKQAKRLSEHEGFAVIIIIGSWNDYEKRMAVINQAKLKRGEKFFFPDKKAYWGSRVSLMLNFGIHVITVNEGSKKAGEMANYVNVVSLMMEKMDKGGSKRKLDKLNLDEDLLTKTVSNFYLIPVDTARALIKQYGTFRKMIGESSEKKLQKVHNIGPKTAKKILEVNKLFDD